jgi:multiple sugar transport system substrate-binding protein
MKRRDLFAILTVMALIGAACSGGDDGSTEPSGSTGTGGEPTQITLWHGYGKVGVQNGVENYEALSMQQLIDEFNDTHDGIQVENVFCCSNDNALQKVTVALQGGQQPDITYQYGTSLPQLANAPGVMDLTERVQDTDFAWDDFFPSSREAATVDGRVLGIPALIDNLAIVYNKDLFTEAGVEEPTPDWTWEDFRAAAKALTDPSNKQYGFAFPADASEDTVWHYDAMLWQAGGDILTEDQSQAAFNSEAGVTALDTLKDMAVTDQSVYLDLQNTKIDDLFNTGKVGMLITGPWALSGYPDVDYGVQVLPSYDGTNHETIAGPDMWVLFDNDEARANAAWEFVKWFTAAQQVEADSTTTGHLPTRQSVLDSPGFIEAFGKKFTGNDVFAENLANVKKARPVLASYDQISQAMGRAIVAVLLGESESQASLDQAAEAVNGILAVPG